jgi:hypothetical protein
MYSMCLRLEPLVSRPRSSNDGALWEIWAAGASHAGGSSSPGHSDAAVPVGLRVPLFTIWDPVAGPGRTPMPGNNSGLSQILPIARVIEPQYRPPGQREILDEGLRGGGPGRPPFWRTPVSPIRGLAR